MSTADDAWRDWFNNEPWQDLTDIRRDAFMAGYRRALEDAADQWQQGQWSDALRGTQRPTQVQARLATAQAVTDWLRDRAAAVGTKDGDDDE